MEAAFGLMVMMLGVCHVAGVETFCDGRQDGAQCYGVLGGTVVLRLMDDASAIPRYTWKKEQSVILIGQQNDIVTYVLMKRSTFIPSTGTFTLKNLSRNDSGEYTLETFDSARRAAGSWTLYLTVQVSGSNLLPVIAGVLSALLVFLAVGVAVIWAHRKKHNIQEEEDEQELTYADVRVVQRQEKKVEQRAEVEVEYGQVKFSEHPRRTRPVGDEFLTR